jgi:predicted transcriptional regulator
VTITQFENKPKRREKLVIMTEIINIAKQGASKTRIMFKASLSFNQLNQYLSFLSRSGLLEKFTDNEREIYKATPKGQEFMERQQQVLDLLNEDAHGEISVKTPPSGKYWSCSYSDRKKQVFF